MSGYTPGPWIAGDDEDSDYYLVGPHDGDGIVYQPVVKLHSEANARLIAAAPTMYEYVASSASNGCAEARKIMEAINAGR